MRSKKRVLIHYLSLIHYRRSFFKYLMRCDDYDFYVLAGRNNPIPSMKNFTDSSSRYIRVFNVNIPFGKNKFTYQFLILLKSLSIRPHAIVLLGYNPLIISSLVTLLIFRTFTKTKILFWGHGTLGNQGKIGRRLRLLVYRMSHGILLYDDKEKDNLGSILSDLPLYVVGNSINDEDYGFNMYDNLENRRNNPDELRLLFTGRITSRKKIDVLIHATQILTLHFDRVSLEVVGSGDEMSNLIDLVKILDLEDYVNFHGSLYGKDLHEIFLKSDIYVMPDAVGLSILHCNSFGLPMITTNLESEHGPEMQYFNNGINGSYYNNHDPISMANEILKWKDRLNANSHKERKNCIDSAMNATPEAMASKFISAIKDF